MEQDGSANEDMVKCGGWDGHKWLAARGILVQELPKPLSLPILCDREAGLSLPGVGDSMLSSTTHMSGVVQADQTHHCSWTVLEQLGQLT